MLHELDVTRTDGSYNRMAASPHTYRKAQMKEHGKKKIAPIVISVIMILYYIFYVGLIISIVPFIWKILLGVFPVLLIGAMIYVCVQRIKEIDGGEEDDLSNY